MLTDTHLILKRSHILAVLELYAAVMTSEHKNTQDRVDAATAPSI
jgi:hypothetical protein